MAQSIREKAIETIQLEAQAVAQLAERIDADFEAAVRAILDCKARVVVTGMGKSGHEYGNTFVLHAPRRGVSR